MNNCPTVDQLKAFVEEKFGDADQQVLDSHIDCCSDCQATLEGLCNADDPFGNVLAAVRVDTAHGNWSFKLAGRIASAIRDTQERVDRQSHDENTV